MSRPSEESTPADRLVGESPSRSQVWRQQQEAGMKYYIAAGHVPGAGARGQGLEEGKVAVQVADALVATLNAFSPGFAVLVPDNLDLGPSIKWVNAHAVAGDRALELHLNSASAAAHGCLVATTRSSRKWAGPLIGGLTQAGIVPWGAGVFDEAV